LAAAEDFAFGHDVGAVGDAEGFADVVVGDEDADSLLVIFTSFVAQRFWVWPSSL
jgi:hypothetical protein